ncbi:vivapain [Plasmodium cynomolgi strain B]|uniref:Vivapain n=1 Tax=Plasmodium cynomolgi (strain B) TaxID=1120755 RepID=K6UT32_PLACD|nr:vivapain [Plasmodium cynomolgi strain B]GAB66429.1 vivapain [Plasmodium cynomolgi strain B]
MEYHMEYSNDKSHKPEKELFVEKSFCGRNDKGKKSLLVALSVSAICLLAGSAFYFTRTGKGNDGLLYGNAHDESSSDDFIITTLLKSPGGKKFIVSKLQELLASYDQRINSGRAKEEEASPSKEGPTDEARSTSLTTVSRQKQGNLKIFDDQLGEESQYAIRKNQHILISEQELVDCSGKNFGCYGGLASLAFDDMIDLGFLCSESEYPYVGFKPHSCDMKKCKEKYTIKSYVKIPEDKYKEAIQFIGPLTLGITVNDDFYDYKEGIFNSECTEEPNHEVMIVGYGVQEIFNSEINASEKHYYYIIKNSWGEEWGEKGFMKIETDELGLKKTNNMTEAYIPLLD